MIRLSIIALFLFISIGVYSHVVTAQSRASEPATLSIDYSRTSLTYVGESDVLAVDTIIRNAGAAKKVGLVLQVQELVEGQLKFVDQIPVSVIDVAGEARVQFAYDVPAFVPNGTYVVSFKVVEAESGAPVSAFLPIKEFVVDHEATHAPFNAGSCALAISEAPGTTFNLVEGPDIAPEETLTLTCDTTGSNLQGSYTLTHANVARVMGSRMIPETAYRSEEIELAPGMLSVVLEHEQTPQAYDYVMYLSREGERVTPYMSAHYVVQGDAATIHSVTVPQMVGENNFSIDVGITGAATNFPNSRAGNREQRARVLVDLYKTESGERAKQIEAPVTLVGGIQVVSLPLDRDAFDDEAYRGVARVMSVDTNNELATKEFIFKRPTVASVLPVAQASSLAYVLIIGLALVVVAWLIVRLRIETLPSVRLVEMACALALLAMLFAGLWLIERAEAAYSTCPGSTQNQIGLYTKCAATSVSSDANTTTSLNTNYGNFGVTQQTDHYDTGGFNYVVINAGLWWADCGNIFGGGSSEFNAKVNMYLNNSLKGSISNLFGAGWTAWSGNGYFVDNNLNVGSNKLTIEFDYYLNGQSPDGTIDAAHIFTINKAAESGNINGAPIPCIVPIGGSSCSATLSWTTTGVGDVFVEVAGLTYSTQSNGSGQVNVTPQFNPTYNLRKDAIMGPILDSVQLRAICASGSAWDGFTCAAPTGGSCGGSIPANASSWGVNELAPVAGFSWAYAPAATFNYCEFKCDVGYGWNGSSCVQQCSWAGGSVGNWTQGSAGSGPCTGTQAPITLSQGQSTPSVPNTASGYSGAISFMCNSGTWVPVGPTCAPTAFSCGGSVPTNGTPWGADESIPATGGVSWVYSPTDGASTYCQFTCSTGYTWNGSSCTPTTYACTGSVPANASAWDGEESSGLTANTPWSQSFSDTATKCQFGCSTGYSWDGSSCVASTFSCTGSVPANASAWDGEESSGLTANTLWSQSGSDTATKCQYRCGSGYSWNGSSCVASSFSCMGSIPANASAWDSEESSGLSANTPWTENSWDSSTKCQFTCTSGYDWNGSSCVAIGGGLPDLSSDQAPQLQSGSLTLGSAVTFRGVVRNSGNMTVATPFRDRFTYRWGTSGTWLSLGVQIPKTIPFAQNATQNDTSVQLLLSNEGDFQIQHCVDSRMTYWYGDVEESNEGNNCRVATFTVGAGGPAPKSAMIRAWDCAIDAGQSRCDMPLTWTTENLVTPNIFKDGALFSSVSDASLDPRFTPTTGYVYTNVPFGSHVFWVIDAATGVEYARDPGTAHCRSGTAWDGAKCAATAVVPIPQCSDSADNDGDGKVDGVDPGCHTDGNPGNPGSYDPSDNDESDTPAGPGGGGSGECADGKDNDDDGVRDMSDPDCISNPSGPEYPRPTITFRACTESGTCDDNSLTIRTGDEVRLMWSSQNATRCDAVEQNGFATGGARSGTDTTIDEPVTNRITFTITCTGQGGARSETVDVVRQSAGPQLEVNPSRVRAGEAVTLSWNTTDSDPTSCRLTGRDVPPRYATIAGLPSHTGQTTAADDIRVDVTTTYTLTCEGGTDTATVTLTSIIHET